MRVVHVVTSLLGGGLERVVVDLVRAGADAGEHPHILCLNKPDETIGELTPNQYTFLPQMSKLSMLVPVQLIRELKRLRPDIVQLHSGVWLKGANAGRLAGIAPIILTEHGRAYPDPFASRLLDGLACRLSHRVVAVSSQLATQLQENLLVEPSKLRVIRNGIVVKPMPTSTQAQLARTKLGLASDTIVIGTVGRLEPIKAVGRLIKAFAAAREIMHNSAHDSVLLLIGDGSERKQLENEAVALGLGRSIRFLGKRGNVHELLGAMDMFVQTSMSEGTSLALLEAMASGTAVIATAVGGTPEVLGLAPGGVLVPSGDHDALVQALTRLSTQPELRKTFGRSGRAGVISHYSFEVMAEAYRKLYRESL